MPNQWDLTNENIENTYQRVLQTPDGVNIYDGTGSLFHLGIYNTATGSYGSFYDTGSYTAASATAIYSMSLSTTDISNGVYIDPTDKTRIYFTNAGVYNFQFSAQFANAHNNTTQDVRIWARKNDVGSINDIPDSAGIITIPGAKGGISGKIISTWNYFLTLAGGDFIQLCWSTDDTGGNVSLITEAAGVSPQSPRVPSLIATAQRIDTFLSNTGSFSGSFIGTHTGSFTGSFTGSLLGTASWADSASQAISASYALSSSYSLSSSYALSSSYSLSSSYALSASYSLSSSLSTTASYYAETDPVFVAKSASLATTGSNIFVGNQTISGSITTTGSVGIGTSATSTEMLLVKGNSATTNNAFKVQNSTPTDIFTIVNNRTSSFNGNVLINNGSTQLKLGIGRFDGSLGITDPLYPIHVVSQGGNDATLMFDGKYTGANPANASVIIAADTNEKNPSLNFLDRNGQPYGLATTYAGPVVKFVLERSGSLSAPLSTNGRRNDFYIVNEFADRSIIFYTSASDGNSNIIAGKPRMAITGSNVGIGTTTPRTILHVVSGSSSNASIQTSDTAVFESNANTYVSIYSPTASNAAVNFGSGGTGGDALGAYIRWNQANNLMTLGTANDGDDINFITGNETSSMYLRNNIGLGIGTTAPLYRLHVRNGAVTNSSTWGGSVGVFENSGSNAYLSVLASNTYTAGIGFGTAAHRVSANLNWNSTTKGFDLATNTASAFLTFGTDTGTERMRITSGGLVGIGTTAPQHLLDVSGSARVTSSLFLPGLTTTSQNNVVTVDITTGQLYYTASTAFGGGSSTPTFPYIGSAIISGSLTVTGSISSLNTTASQETFSSTAYVSGDIIQGTIGGGVTIYDLIYLDIDGTWKDVSQTTTSSTKMLGIYIGGDQILIDGNISSTTYGIGSPIGPSIQNPDQGLPVYIDLTPSQYNTTIPTTDYVRTLGYVYYNNASNINNWVLKFRPSTDWYKI